MTPRGGPVNDDEDEIRRTLGRYSLLCDDGRFDEWGELFTEDARLELMGKVTTGRRAIVTYMQSVQPAESRGLHMTSGSLVEVDEAIAAATTNYIFVRPTTEGVAIVAAGRYYDQLVRDGRRWLFAQRRITLASPPNGSDHD
jgi:3-phenylpropionate/cinnamic acid dioxygenase small subunit